MIYTCTLNPSLDYFMEFENPLAIDTGHIFRSHLEYFESGGKGVNSSIVLNNLGVPSRALGFVGTFNKDYYIKLLTKYPLLEPRFTQVEGSTRINVKATGASCLELNGTGPSICDKDFELFKTRCLRLMEDDVFILGGSCQDYLLDRVKELLAQLSQNGIKICIDSSNQVVQMCQDIETYLVLLDYHDACELFECENDLDTIVKQAIAYQKASNKFLIITYEKNKSLLFYDKKCYIAQAIDLPENRINGVGFDDSILAGFVMNSLRSIDVLESFKFANSCGQATLMSKGLATKEHIDSIFDAIEVKQLV